ncbi:MAG: glycosyltransferase, partial [Planctomycetes bacterium]|nr:glycosyltransferase [Planctomycetota bacterium]
LYVPLLNLPGIFNTQADNIPAPTPYLFAKEPKIQHWRSKIQTDAFKIGIAWAGNPIHTNDHNRSCALQNFTPLAEIRNVKLFSLQKGPGIEQIKNWQGAAELIDLGQAFEDFTDTAAAIENMDLIISVDTSVIHLAGAMGKPVWTLLPFMPDWRWMMEKQDCPWYPTMRLFRQERPGNWHGLFEQLAHMLHKLANNV